MSSGTSNSDLKPGLDKSCKYSELFPKAMIFVKCKPGWV